MHDRVDVHLQPIVQFPTRATAHYEAFSRLRDADGRVIMPSEFVPAAGAAGLAGPLDSFQLARCIAIAKRLDAQGVAARLFCNIAGPALADASFRCELIRYLETHAELASHIVLEFGARDLTDSPSARAAAVRATGSSTDRPDLGGVSIAELHTQYTHQELLLRRALGITGDVAVTPSGGSLLADPLFSAGLERIGYAAEAIWSGGTERALAHATSGHLLQQNLICLLEGRTA